MNSLSRSQIALLSPAERIDLIAALWDSLTDEQTPISQAQRDEIERRLESFEADCAQGVTWEALKAELSRRAF